MLNPLFSIVTITYNSARWVNRTIETVLDSGYKNFEFIICDDYSADNTWEIINSYNDPRIKKFRHGQNTGEYNNRNFALKHATGQYLLFVDGDDELYRDTLDNLTGYIGLFPQAGSIWGVPESEINFCRLPILLYPEDILNWIYLANIRVAQIGFAETLFKTDLLKSLGGFSTKYISGDTHVKKLCALEAPVLLIPSGLVYWRVSEGQASSRLSINYNGFRNNVAIDNELLGKIKNRVPAVTLLKIEKNIRIRNIKLLFKHTFRKGKIADGITLFKELDFTCNDLKYLFKYGDYSYLNQLKNH